MMHGHTNHAVRPTAAAAKSRGSSQEQRQQGQQGQQKQRMAELSEVKIKEPALPVGCSVILHGIFFTLSLNHATFA